MNRDTLRKELLDGIQSLLNNRLARAIMSTEQIRLLEVQQAVYGLDDFAVDVLVAKYKEMYP